MLECQKKGWKWNKFNSFKDELQLLRWIPFLPLTTQREYWIATPAAQKLQQIPKSVPFWYFGMLVLIYGINHLNNIVAVWGICTLRDALLWAAFKWNRHKAFYNNGIDVREADLWIIQSVKLGQSIKSLEQIFRLQDIYNKLFVRPPPGKWRRGGSGSHLFVSCYHRCVVFALTGFLNWVRISSTDCHSKVNIHPQKVSNYPSK